MNAGGLHSCRTTLENDVSQPRSEGQPRDGGETLGLIVLTGAETESVSVATQKRGWPGWPIVRSVEKECLQDGVYWQRVNCEHMTRL